MSNAEVVNLKAKTLLELRKRLIKNFMDILILRELKTIAPMSGYDVIALIHKRFDFLVGSGRVYSLLYSMERGGLIKGVWSERKRVYTLTDKGEEILNEILNAREKVQNLVSIFFIKT